MTDHPTRRAPLQKIFQPPGDAALHEGWHYIHTHIGRLRLQWRPGTATWRDSHSVRWTDASAAGLGWRYDRAAPECDAAKALTP